MHAFESAQQKVRVFGLSVREEVEQGDFSEPSFRLSKEQAQELMDELWRVGLRPTEGTGSAGSLAATQKHLEDMRRLVFDGAEAGK